MFVSLYFFFPIIDSCSSWNKANFPVFPERKQTSCSNLKSYLKKSVLEQPSAFHKILTSIIFGMSFLLTRKCVLNLGFKYISFLKMIRIQNLRKVLYCNLENNMSITEENGFLKFAQINCFAKICFQYMKIITFHRVILPLV